jgi:4-carboxymuconolactone decarboxylase
MTPDESQRASESTSHQRASRYEQGMAVRRRVLGEKYVDRSIEAADDFSLPMQELTTEFCWGAIWTRPGLDLRTRSILNLGMLTALNRSHELAAHIRGALNNGVTRDEIREVLLQTAVYVGVPAALESFRTAQRVLAEIEQE